jgi:hypothetical protein
VNLLGTITFAAGAILIYSAVKDKTPIEVFKDLQSKNKLPDNFTPSQVSSPGTPPIAQLRTGN